MSGSVSLATYMALARRAPPQGWRRPEGARPDGALIWCHAAGSDRIPGLLQAAERLAAQRDDVAVLLTGGEGVARPEKLRDCAVWADLPPENVTAVEAFLDHWRPDIGLWSGGDLRPALVTKAGQRGCPLYLVDAPEEGFDEARWRWLPAMSGAVLGQFRRVFAISANAGRRLQRLGVPLDRIEVTGPLQEGSTALACDETLRAELSETLARRPVWVAALLRPEELDEVLEAHRAALRIEHRLLLVVVPDRESDGPAFARAIAAGEWRHVVWSRGEMPQETTEVLLADTRGEMGLWYRLAPIAFMGSSLRAGLGGSDPWEPAALGAAVLYGPHPGRHLGAYRRFAAAGAARIVKDAKTLSAAVTRLSAPDQAAAMARAAWEVATEGAEVTDRLLELLHDELDRRRV